MRPGGADLRGLSFRRAGEGDVGALVELRLEFMRIVKDLSPADEAEWRLELAPRFSAELAAGVFVAWICLDQGEPVAASGIAFAAAWRAGAADRRGGTADRRAGTAEGRGEMAEARAGTAEGRAGTAASRAGTAASREEMAASRAETAAGRAETAAGRAEMNAGRRKMASDRRDATRDSPDSTQESPDFIQESPDSTQESPDSIQESPDSIQESPEAIRARRAASQHSPTSPGEALIFNMFTRPAYRGRGIATELLRLSLEEGRARGVARFRLQPTCESRALYERAGFVAAGEEMRLDEGGSGPRSALSTD